MLIQRPMPAAPLKHSYLKIKIDFGCFTAQTRVGVTGALCLTNGIFAATRRRPYGRVNLLYHRILLTAATAIQPSLIFRNPSRKSTQWSMGSSSLKPTGRFI
jgi:hypothetical protein